MKTLHGLDFFLGIILWCISLIRICIGSAEPHDYIVIFFSSGILIYDIGKLIEKRKKLRNTKETENE